MSRRKLIDAFPFHDELDILEMRLTELHDVVDHFIVVEADVTHQDDPKPSYYRDNAERFAPWADKITHVWGTGLPTKADNPDPWAREFAQREHIATGLAAIGASDIDILMQSDVDEIPRALHARNVRPNGVQVFGQRGHFWAVDWQHPHVWLGTTVCTVGMVAGLHPTMPFASMRNLRGLAPCPPHLQDAGWHFSWLGGPERATHKVNSFCHPEVEERIRTAIADENFYWREGWHCDGVKMAPVEVNDEWPRWIIDGNAPTSWFRPRIEMAA